MSAINPTMYPKAAARAARLARLNPPAPRPFVWPHLAHRIVPMTVNGLHGFMGQRTLKLVIDCLPLLSQAKPPLTYPQAVVYGDASEFDHEADLHRAMLPVRSVG